MFARKLISRKACRPTRSENASRLLVLVYRERCVRLYVIFIALEIMESPGIRAVSRPFSSPEAALLLVSTKVQHRKSAIHGLPVTLRMLRVKSDKCDWFWSQSIVFTKPFKTGMSLDRARGRDFWC